MTEEHFVKYWIDYAYIMMLPMLIDKDDKKVFASEEEKSKEALKYLNKEYGNS